MTEVAKPDDQEQLIAAVAQHRQIIQGMSVHLQQLEGKIFELQEQFGMLLEVVNQIAEGLPDSEPEPENVDEATV